MYDSFFQLYDALTPITSWMSGCKRCHHRVAVFAPTLYEGKNNTCIQLYTKNVGTEYIPRDQGLRQLNLTLGIGLGSSK